MERLIYTSTAAENLSSPDVFAIVAQSERNNSASGIGGFLIHSGGRFLQLLEGPALRLEALMAEIEADARHHGVEVIYRAPAEETWFPDWDMKPLISFSGTPGLEELREVLAEKDPSGEIMGHVLSFLEGPAPR
ncbi:BLUF domain-containing protein [Paraurantiacibacter namhicola]|uniref:Sensors of blue-light using FAD n=1 Tax=Paraurantiacibacter namhicola TaxID=645517 RepID=A0A1C7D5X1_9SPHN|nr:BLUF domain-containing protein [Paraurantiacibacter namhicola]ANU06752.1 Sensors of blue-light using FAD [Paraurantiacibacter namhicola]